MLNTLTPPVANDLRQTIKNKPRANTRDECRPNIDRLFNSSSRLSWLAALSLGELAQINRLPQTLA